MCLQLLDSVIEAMAFIKKLRKTSSVFIDDTIDIFMKRGLARRVSAMTWKLGDVSGDVGIGEIGEFIGKRAPMG